MSTSPDSKPEPHEARAFEQSMSSQQIAEHLTTLELVHNELNAAGPDDIIRAHRLSKLIGWLNEELHARGDEALVEKPETPIGRKQIFPAATL